MEVASEISGGSLRKLYGGPLRLSTRIAMSATEEIAETLIRRPKRADARRNYEKVLAAAREAFAEGGESTALEEIARRAGVGIGTLYRHFPTREALFEAVYRREVDELAALAEHLRDETPAQALRLWVKANVEFVATKKGMAAALAVAAHTKDLSAYSYERLTAAAAGLLERARAAGALRVELRPEELFRALIGMCLVHDQPGWQATVIRLMDVFLDGMLAPERS